MDKLENNSQKLMESIEQALEEEKVPRWKRMGKILGLATLVAMPFFYAIHSLWPSELDHERLVLISTLWGLLVAGLYFYFKPQPRVAVRGYWSAWIWAKLLLAMTITTTLEILFCPELASLSGVPSFTFTQRLPEIFMSWGGMTLCMFFCGIIFSSISASVGLFFVRKSLPNTSWRKLLAVVGITFLGQLPVILLQLLNEHARSYLPHWVAGSALALFGLILIIRLTDFLRKIRLKND